MCRVCLRLGMLVTTGRSIGWCVRCHNACEVLILVGSQHVSQRRPIHPFLPGNLLKVVLTVEHRPKLLQQPPPSEFDRSFIERRRGRLLEAVDVSMHRGQRAMLQEEDGHLYQTDQCEASAVIDCANQKAYTTSERLIDYDRADSTCARRDSCPVLRASLQQSSGAKGWQFMLGEGDG